MKRKVLTLLAVLGMGLGSLLVFAPSTPADISIPGMGSGAYDVPSVGGPGDAVDKAPVCDMKSRPKISKVEPEPAKPGDKVTIKGENFGTKECFVGVSFGSMADGSTISYQYVNETTVEATVPEIKPGLTRVNVVTSGGSSQAFVLIQAK